MSGSSAVPATTLIANARMYAVTPAVARAWRALFAEVGAAAGVPLEVIDHAPPAPLETLWTRADLGAAFMCGWPWSRATPRPLAVAAPIPSPARYGGRPVYATDFVVRADSRASSLADTFGGKLAWTVDHSHSGFNAPRFHLLRYRSDARPRLYAATLGPLLTPRRVVEAVIAGAADVGPLDSWWHDLLRRHEPETAAKLRLIETTDLAPIPLLVAAPGVDADAVARLRASFLAAPSRPAWPARAAPLLLAGFAGADPAAYALAEARAAAAAGYAEPGWPA